MKPEGTDEEEETQRRIKSCVTGKDVAVCPGGLWESAVQLCRTCAQQSVYINELRAAPNLPTLATSTHTHTRIAENTHRVKFPSHTLTYVF